MKRIGVAGILMVIVASTAFAFASQNAANADASGKPAKNFALSALAFANSSLEISASELTDNAATGFVVIDLRLPEDFARGSLPGAVNVPPLNLLAQIGSMTTSHEQPILLFGYNEEHTIRSVLALRMLQYTRVYHTAKSAQESGKTAA